MAKKLKWYLVEIPVRQTWCFRVVATNKAEAIAKAQNGGLEQAYSYAGWPTRNRSGRLEPTEKPQAWPLRAKEDLYDAVVLMVTGIDECQRKARGEG